MSEVHPCKHLKYAIEAQALIDKYKKETEVKDALCRELLEKLQKANDDLRHYTYIDHYLDLIKRAEEILNK